MFLLHPETKEVGLGDDEVEVLVVNLCNLFRGACCGCLRREILQ